MVWETQNGRQWGKNLVLPSSRSNQQQKWVRTRDQSWGRGLGGSPLTGVGRLCQAPVEDLHALLGVEKGIKSLSLLSSGGFIYAFVLMKEREKERSARGRWPGRLWPLRHRRFLRQVRHGSRGSDSMKLIVAGEVDELSNFLTTFSPMDLSSFFPTFIA